MIVHPWRERLTVFGRHLCWVLKQNWPLPPTVPLRSALCWEMPQRNTAVATLFSYRVEIRQKHFLFWVLSFWGPQGTSDLVTLLKGTLCSPVRASPGLCQAFPAFPALPALLLARSVTQTLLAAFETQSTACIWPDIMLCSVGQRLLASQQIQAGWIWPHILNAEEIKPIHVVLFKNFDPGRLVSVCVFWEPH